MEEAREDVREDEAAAVDDENKLDLPEPDRGLSPSDSLFRDIDDFLSRNDFHNLSNFEGLQGASFSDFLLPFLLACIKKPMKTIIRRMNISSDYVEIC